MSDRKKRGTTLRPVEGAVHQFAVLGEMTGLLQRVRGNKSKRTESGLLKTGPFRISVVALDAGGKLANHAAAGPFTVQCLLGRVAISVAGGEHRLTTGDLIVADAGAAHDISAEEASVLLVTVATGLKE